MARGEEDVVTLRAALKLAKRAGLWRGDPDELIPVAFSPAYVPRTRWLPPEELTLLLGELAPDHAARVAFIVATSASWGDTDRAERADLRGTSVLVRGTKRATRWREVPIVIEAQRSLIAYAAEHAGGRPPLLFAPWTNVRRDLHAACRRARIDPCSPNDLRRTTAQWLRRAGAPVELLAPLMGHADGRMVERVYGRLDAAALGRLLAAACDAGVPESGAERGRSGQGGIAEEPGKEGSAVPKPRVELGTRGFSVLRFAWRKPRKPSQFDATRARRVTPVCRRRA